MKISHRRGITMEEEYGIEKSNELKKNLSLKIQQLNCGEFYYYCTKCNIRFLSNQKLWNKTKYCSDECSGRNRPCATCGKLVDRITELENSVFCNHKCYWMWMKDNIRPPQTENRRLRANSVEATEKRKKTNIDKGWWNDSSIFVENLNYSDYVDAVRYMTKKLKPTIYENWNGYDYYDGEYIKDNFEKFHFTHGNFPSIDHKISCFKGFQNKWPPSKVCELENMVVTKKRINSSKQQRDSDEFKIYLETKKRNL